MQVSPDLPRQTNDGQVLAPMMVKFLLLIIQPWMILFVNIQKQLNYIMIPAEFFW